jgi:hypothetical protein
MTKETLKEAIADYGFEATIEAMMQLIRDGYLLPFYSRNESNSLRFHLETLLEGWIKDHNLLSLAEYNFPNFTLEDS